MSNSIFYKVLAAISTAGLIAIAGLLVPIATKQDNDIEGSIAKTQQELKKARKEALDEVEAARNGVLGELRKVRADAVGEVKAARRDALNSLKKSGGDSAPKTWLVLRFTEAALQKIPMKDMAQCEMQGAVYSGSKRLHPQDYRGFECFESE